MSADVFENFQNICLKINELDTANSFCGPGLAWQADLKKTKVKLDLSNDIDMLLIVEKVKAIRGGESRYLSICESL